MQILLANAKTMFDNSERQALTTPRFQSVANTLAAEMAQMDVDSLARQLDCSHKLAAEAWMRFQRFADAPTMPALLAYNGQAYKHLKAQTLSGEALDFAQRHLWITCFLYGLLRPLDAVVPYRMEHCVRLEHTGDRPVNQFWKDKLTDVLINAVRADDGVLLHLSTEEYEHLFDWKRVTESVRVVHPLFYVRQPDGRLRQQAVWAKSCRGAMVRHVLEQALTSPTQLSSFAYRGFRHAPDYGDDLFPHFIRETP